MTVQGHPYAPLSAQDARHLGVGVVEQLIRIDPRLTVARAVLRGTALADAPEARVRARARAVLAEIGLDLDPDALVSDVPRFVHGLVEAARVLAEDTQLIVMDEVSASLTPGEVEGLHAVARRLRSEGRGRALHQPPAARDAPGGRPRPGAPGGPDRPGRPRRRPGPGAAGGGDPGRRPAPDRRVRGPACWSLRPALLPRATRRPRPARSPRPTSPWRCATCGWPAPRPAWTCRCGGVRCSG